MPTMRMRHARAARNDVPDTALWRCRHMRWLTMLPRATLRAQPRAMFMFVAIYDGGSAMRGARMRARSAQDVMRKRGVQQRHARERVMPEAPPCHHVA